MIQPGGSRHLRLILVHMLLLLPFVGLLWVPLYDRATPALFGFPFFYWYQLAWVPLTAMLIWIVWKFGRA